MNIYVGNLAREAVEDDLMQAFTPFGAVKSAAIIKDKFTGESRGFGFVEMDDKEAGLAAIAGLNGKEIKGRPLTVNEARPKTEGGGGGGRGGFGGGRGGGGGGGRGGRSGGSGGGGGGWGKSW
jgi:RNA recognition motif-containing protein